MRQAILSLLVALLLAGPLRAEGTDGQPERGPKAQIRKLGENLGKLDLSPQQQQQVKAITDEMLQKLETLKQEAKAGGAERPMEKLNGIMADARNRLTDVLTPEQKLKLRDLMQQDRADQVKRESDAKKPVEAEKKPDRREARADPPAKKPEAKSAESKMGEDMMSGGAAKPARERPAPSPIESYKPIDPGSVAPDIATRSLADKPVSLSAMKGKVVVLVFGSYTCPSFRQRVAAMEKLAKETSLRATFYVVYTREAHALGEWEVERNKDDNIEVEQPKTDAERRDLARLAVNTLKITLPVIVDDMSDTLAKAYGIVPNGAVVIGRDGTIAGRQRWFEPVALRALIDTAAAVRNPPPSGN